MQNLSTEKCPIEPLNRSDLAEASTLLDFAVDKCSTHNTFTE